MNSQDKIAAVAFARQGQGRSAGFRITAHARWVHIVLAVVAALLAVVALYGFTYKAVWPTLIGVVGSMVFAIVASIEWDKWSMTKGPWLP